MRRTAFRLDDRHLEFAPMTTSNALGLGLAIALFASAAGAQSDPAAEAILAKIEPFRPDAAARAETAPARYTGFPSTGEAAFVGVDLRSERRVGRARQFAAVTLRHWDPDVEIWDLIRIDCEQKTVWSMERGTYDSRADTVVAEGPDEAGAAPFSESLFQRFAESVCAGNTPSADKNFHQLFMTSNPLGKPSEAVIAAAEPFRKKHETPGGGPARLVMIDTGKAVTGIDLDFVQLPGGQRRYGLVVIPKDDDDIWSRWGTLTLDCARRTVVFGGLTSYRISGNIHSTTKDAAEARPLDQIPTLQPVLSRACAGLAPAQAPTTYEAIFNAARPS